VLSILPLLLLFSGSPFQTTNGLFGRWLLTVDLPDSKYRLPVEITRADDRILVAALGKGIEFSDAVFENKQLRLKGKSSAFGSFEITAIVDGSAMKGQWHAGLIGGGIVGEYQPVSSSPQLRLKIFDEVCQTIEKEYFEPTLNGSDWTALQAKYRPQAENLSSDSQLFQLVNKLLGEMKTSHLSFAVLSPSEEFTSNSKSTEISWRQLSSEVGYLKISRFEEGADFVQLIDRAFDDLGGLPALIIDLRNNGGGTLSAAMRLGDYLLDKPQPLGFFATRFGLEQRKLKSMDQIDIASLPVYSGYDVNDFLSALRKTGAVAIVAGGRAKRTYRGKIVILINERCASSAEGFVGVVKELKLATLIGPRPTAGAMLSSKQVKMSGGWTLTLPEADFRTPRGMRLEGRGVEPDITVTPIPGKDVALSQALEFLKHSLQ
jgi:carboxyl-terminal processing protease